MDRRARILAPLLGLALALVIVRGCGSGSGGNGPNTPEQDARADGDGGLDAYHPDRDADATDVATDSETGGETDGGSVDSPESNCPATGVPAGWIEYPVMDGKYELFVPPSKDLLPEGLTWEACTKDLGPDSFECRQVQVSWPSVHDAPYGLGGIAPGYVEPDGRVVLQLCEAYECMNASGKRELGCMGVVVEADGPVRQAFWMDYGATPFPPMSLSNLSIAPGKATWLSLEWNGGDVTREVSIGGDDTDLAPPILLDRVADSPDAAVAYAGHGYYLEQGYVPD